MQTFGPTSKKSPTAWFIAIEANSLSCVGFATYASACLSVDDAAPLVGA
jgi:hypothetical protein